MWTEDEDAFLRALAAEDDSAAIIATKLTQKFKRKFSKNAVIGRLHRLGMQRLKLPRKNKTGSRIKIKHAADRTELVIKRKPGRLLALLSWRGL